MRSVFVIILMAMVFAGCATQRNTSKVKIRHPSNSVSEEIVATVQSDGSFSEKIRKGDSTVTLAGHVIREDYRVHKVTYDYQTRIETAPGIFSTKGVRSAVNVAG